LLIQQTVINSNEQKLKNVTFCITGKLNNYKNRTELKNLIESYGGKVTDSVSSKTNYLINNDKNSTSSKNKKANDLGIQIISEQDYLKMIGETN
jgi:DNA ligase (NAD+)